MRDSGRVSTEPNFEKSCAGISGMPAPCAACRRGNWSADGCEQVVLGEAAFRAAPRHRREVHAKLAGQGAYTRACVHTFEVGRRPGLDGDHRRAGLCCWWRDCRGGSAGRLLRHGDRVRSPLVRRLLLIGQRWQGSGTRRRCPGEG